MEDYRGHTCAIMAFMQSENVLPLKKYNIWRPKSDWLSTCSAASKLCSKFILKIFARYLEKKKISSVRIFLKDVKDKIKYFFKSTSSTVVPL